MHVHLARAFLEKILWLTNELRQPYWRKDASGDLIRAKQRLKSFLLRNGHRYSGSATWGGQTRLHTRYKRLKARQLNENKPIIAMARELSSFIWELQNKRSITMPPKPTA